MYVRSLAPHVQRALEQFRVVAIVGARQVGKSTLADDARAALRHA
jgi:predicted AAA+ superfamily ATPase